MWFQTADMRPTEPCEEALPSPPSGCSFQNVNIGLSHPPIPCLLDCLRIKETYVLTSQILAQARPLPMLPPPTKCVSQVLHVQPGPSLSPVSRFLLTWFQLQKQKLHCQSKAMLLSLREAGQGSKSSFVVTVS